MSLELIPLACPKCSADLMGPEEGPIFGCPRCRATFDMSVNPPVEIPRAFLLPGQKKGEKPVYLPFWLLHTKPSFIAKDGAKRAKLEKHAPKLERIFVWAWHIEGAIYFGDPLRELNKTGFHAEFDREPDGFLPGASITLPEATRLARFLLLRTADEFEDVTGVDVEPNIQKAILCGVPFYPDGKMLVSAFSDSTYRREIAGSYPVFIQKTS